MTVGIADATYLLNEPKRILIPEGGGWVERSGRGMTERGHFFEGRVQMVAGSIPRSCWFRSTVWVRAPETFTFQLECDLPEGRSHLPLYRLDVKPSGAHTNGCHGPAELHHLLIPAGQTHEHCCLDHVVESEGRIRAGGVQTARPLKLDFEDFASGLAYVCAKLNIENQREIPVPHAQGSLF